MKGQSQESKQMSNFFGKKNKNPAENSACLLACTINFLKAPQQKVKVKQKFIKFQNIYVYRKKTSNIQKLEKYMARCKQIITIENDKGSIQLADCEYLQVALHNLILNAHLLPFETKKDVYTILCSSLKISISCVQYFSIQCKTITAYLISNFEQHDMSFFVGNLLRILLKQEFLEVILDLQLLDSIIKVSKNAVFEIASEALETFHVIFNQKKPKQKQTLSKFLLDNHNEDNLKKVMNVLNCEEQGGFKEVALILFDHFLQLYSTIDNQKVKHIIERNKMLLIQCIKQCLKDTNKETQGETEDRKDYMIHMLEKI